jgi:hypothetical protein
MGRWKSLPACLGYQETSTRAHDRMQALLMTPGLYTNRDLHLQYTLPRYSELSPTGYNIIVPNTDSHCLLYPSLLPYTRLP